MRPFAITRADFRRRRVVIAHELVTRGQAERMARAYRKIGCRNVRVEDWS